VSLLCAAEGCDRPVKRQPGQRGRPPIYCSAQCRPSRPGQGARRVEVDVEPVDDNDGDRSFVVRLRRGTRSVVVATDVGRISAAVLAAEIRAVLEPRTRQEGVTIE